MDDARPSKDHSSLVTDKLLPWILFIFLSFALFHLYFYPLPQFTQIPIYSSSSTFDFPALEQEQIDNKTSCDYSNGKWVEDASGPLYNGTACGTIKEGQNCATHGRPDMGFLYWRWKPNQCNLPRFETVTFLQFLANKHLAFVGDSLARNQLESLLCMLATISVPNLVYNYGEENKFRRWHFDSHDVTISLYWSPFLVKGVEKSNSDPNNKLYLDYVDDRWAAELGSFDMLVLSIGHWFLLPGVYYEGSDHVLGCHYCPGLNYTEIGFYGMLSRALRTTLKTIIERRGTSGNGIEVVVTTFPPSHFEGEWDKSGACAKTRPFEAGEKVLEVMDAKMRQAAVEEVESAKLEALKLSNKFRVEALDVTNLSSMRPDGHPGPYMHPFPFANGVSEHVQNDCVHWCLPGPIDTWNEMLLELVKRWRRQSRKRD